MVSQLNAEAKKQLLTDSGSRWPTWLGELKEKVKKNKELSEVCMCIIILT